MPPANLLHQVVAILAGHRHPSRALCHDHWLPPSPSTGQIDITS
jgi:hypothetical protein